MELLKMNGKSRCSAYLRCVSSFAFRVPPAPDVLAKRCDPLTRPAPAGESADSGPRTPARGEGWRIGLGRRPASTVHCFVPRQAGRQEIQGCSAADLPVRVQSVQVARSWYSTSRLSGSGIEEPQTYTQSL